MRSLCIRLSLAILCLLSVTHNFALASVLAIDYGSDWIKASLMKPGVPFDVLLNRDSKRKMQSSVGWKKTDRLFGSDAYNIAGRFPQDSFSSLKFLLASSINSEAASYFAKISTAELLETSRGTTQLRRSDGSEWTVEELIAMQLAYVRGIAEDLAGERVDDVIVTVPAFFSQFERDALADAIEISGLRLLALINDGTAIAVNYAMTRKFDEPEYHVIYDAGASAIRATVVRFSTEGKGKSAATQIQVAGVGHERGVGGTELDRRLRDILADDFVAKHKRDIRSDKRGMAKLWKEAGRVKAILSANHEAAAHVESLAFDIDFKTKISRKDFEEACTDLRARFSSPVLDALSNAGLSLQNITSVILAGGSSRTPMVQAAVKAAVGENKIAMNVNADEAAVLGAALHGASLSRQFKTKDIKVQEIGAHSIVASYPAPGKTQGTAARVINTVIFPAGSKTGTKKTVTFKHTEDFAVKLEYKSPVAPGFPTSVLEASISGVREALANLTERGAVDPVVKATVALSESGFVSVKDAHVWAEIKDDTLTGKLKGLFGGGSASSDDAASQPDTSSESPSSVATAPSDIPVAEKKVTLKDSNTIPLDIITNFLGVRPLTPAEKRASRDSLLKVTIEETAKERKEEARNVLEGYLYRMRDLLDETNTDTPFRKCSQEAERKVLHEKVEESIAWLHDKGDSAETSQFWDKRNTIESLERPVVHRYQEIEAFPQALNVSQMWNWSTRLFLTEAHANLTEEAAAGIPSKWTKADLDGLEKTLKEHETWLNEWVEKQKSVKMNEDPVIETTEMKARAKTLEMHLQRMVRKKAPKPKKTSTSIAPSSTATVEPEETSTPVAETESSPKSSPPVKDNHDEL